jgi:hypothetical protein
MKFTLNGYVCEMNGGRGYSCPTLKLYGYSSERALASAIKSKNKQK